MPKEEWGTKRVCPTTGKHFYDLNADPIISPYTGETVTIKTTKDRTMVADAVDPETKKLEAVSEADNDGDDVVLEDDDDDEVLEDDDDVLEDIGDIATQDDEDE